MEQLLAERMIWGLGIGFLLTLLVFVSKSRQIWKLNKELRQQQEKIRLRDEGQVEQSSIFNEKIKKLEDAMKDLHEKNEKLVSAMNILKNEPDKEGKMTLVVYDEVRRRLTDRYTSFGQLWERTCREVEHDIQHAYGDSGRLFAGPIKRMFQWFIPNRPAIPHVESSGGDGHGSSHDENQLLEDFKSELGPDEPDQR